MKTGKGKVIILESPEERETIYWALKEIELGRTLYVFDIRLVKKMLNIWDNLG